MSKKNVGGRPALYQPKDGKVQVRFITTKGARLLDHARAYMKTMSEWPGKVTDSDVVEFLVRCWRYGKVAATKEIEPKE